uniref:Uncharacterized protein n=1 Tax=Rhizophora mucronata TaxID=61149 RepID=A0A2P2P2E1_RHIMU
MLAKILILLNYARHNSREIWVIHDRKSHSCAIMSKVLKPPGQSGHAS